MKAGASQGPANVARRRGVLSVGWPEGGRKTSRRVAHLVRSIRPGYFFHHQQRYPCRCATNRQGHGKKMTGIRSIGAAQLCSRSEFCARNKKTSSAPDRFVKEGSGQGRIINQRQWRIRWRCPPEKIPWIYFGSQSSGRQATAVNASGDGRRLSGAAALGGLAAGGKVRDQARSEHGGAA